VRLNSRIAELGAAGIYLQSMLPKDIPDDLLDRGLTGQIVYIESLVSNDTVDNRISALATSVLLADVSFQTRNKDTDLIPMLDSIFPRLEVGNLPGFKKYGNSYRRDYKRYDLCNERKLRFFPLKNNPASTSKVNIKFSDVIEGMKKYAPHTYSNLNKHLPYMIGMTNDQACNYSLMALCLDKLGLDGVRYALGMFRDNATCKGLSIVIKSSGLNNSRLGSMLCECQCLTGRAVSPIDLVEKTKERCGTAGKNLTMPKFTDDELRKNIRAIISEELDVDAVKFKSREEFWDARWLWCKNGGHARALEKEHPEYHTKMRGRIHRRVAVESWHDNPLDTWDGKAYISASAKLEQGKTRLVLASDTVSYICFEYFFSPIESAWRNTRVLLNPDSGGHIGTALRVLKLSGNVWVMLDYDDFNSQHTLRAQELVIECLAESVSFTDPIVHKLRESLYMMRARADGVDCGYITSTLMSGHRGTTIFNSILNAAYIRASNPQLWHEFASLHTGDDVVSRFNSYATIELLLKNLTSRGLRLNPLKQSVGRYCAEFLRLSISEHCARGYLPRSIASFVSGNWAADHELGTEEYLNSIVGSTRSMLNRGAPEELAHLLALGLRKRVGIGTKRLFDLLIGSKGLGNGPVYGYTYLYNSINMYSALSEESEGKFFNELSDVDSFATQAYLINKISPLERTALIMTGSSIKNTMLAASYAKTLNSRLEDIKHRNVRFRTTGERKVKGSELASKLIHRRPFDGYLTRYPAINLIKSKLNKPQLEYLLRMIGKYKPSKPVEELAWGNSRQGKIIVGSMSYSDASMLSNRIKDGIIYVDYSVYM
jgi:hypothetical protein